MKRYWLFTFDHHSERGGIHDFVGSFAELHDAQNHRTLGLHDVNDPDVMQVVDTLDGTVMVNAYGRGWGPWELIQRSYT